MGARMGAVDDDRILDQPILVLAGGASRRMGGGDKGLYRLGDRPILSHLLERLAPQSQCIAINAGGDPSRFSGFARPLLSDTLPGGRGPLAGILTGIRWVERMLASHDCVITVPTDTPFLAPDLVARFRMAHAASADEILIAMSGGRRHPTVGLFPTCYGDDLEQAMIQGGLARVQDWVQRHPHRVIPFETGAVDPFFNINTPDDLAWANCYLAQDMA